MKLTRTATGHFVMLIEIGLRLINYISGHIQAVSQPSPQIIFLAAELNYSFQHLYFLLQVVKTATGACSETMTRKIWDVKSYVGQIARVKLVDSSSGWWMHINFDDLKGDIRCM